MDGVFVQMYEDKMKNTLKKMREDYEAKLADIRSGFGAIYKKKICDLSEKLANERGRVTELETTNEALSKRLREMQDQMDEAARNHRADMDKKDHKINNLELEISGRAAKRKRLMETEEYSGFNITTSHTQPGQWLIEPIEKDIQCIKVRNVGEEEGSLGGYTLQSLSGGMETKYKFHRTVKVVPGEVVSVWNSDAGQEHQPSEGQLVMKEGGFTFKDTVETALLDKDNEVVATRETTLTFAGRRLHCQSVEDDKNCVIM